MGILTDDDSLIDAALSELKSLPLDLRHRRDPRRDYSYILKQHHLGQVSKRPATIPPFRPSHRPAPAGKTHSRAERSAEGRTRRARARRRQANAGYVVAPVWRARGGGRRPHLLPTGGGRHWRVARVDWAARRGQGAFAGRGKSERGMEHGAERCHVSALGPSELGSLGVLEEPPLVGVFGLAYVLVSRGPRRMRVVGFQLERFARCSECKNR